MIFTDNKNTRGDIQRLIWYIIPLVVSFALGFLIHKSYYEQRPIQSNSCSCPNVLVTCEPTVRLYQLPLNKLPQT